MSVTQTLSSSASSDSATISTNGTILAVGATEQAVNQTFAAGGSNVALPIDFAHATLKSVVLLSDQNMTILVNSTSSPILTINLIAGWPYVWNASDGYFANPFSADVTAFYVTNTPAARLKGRVLN